VLDPALPGRSLAASGSAVLSHQQPSGCRPKPLKFGSAPCLSEWQATTVASSRRQVTPSSTLSAMATPGSAPCRVSICAHAARRAAFTAPAIRPSVRPPPAAISSSPLQHVGTDATSPNSSRWSAITRKSLITCAPSAIAHARSASTRPRSRTSGQPVASAFDNPPVRPVLSATARSNASPACDTTPVPPAMTSSPLSHPVAFTSKVLLVLGRKGRQIPLSSQFRSTFSSRRAALAHTAMNSQG
jgi:hypothetical protein